MAHQKIFVALVYSFVMATDLANLASAEVIIPASTAYLDPDVRGARVSRRSGITAWKDSEIKVLWFGQIKTPGQLECSVRMRLSHTARRSAGIGVCARLETILFDRCATCRCQRRKAGTGRSQEITP